MGCNCELISQEERSEKFVADVYEFAIDISKQLAEVLLSECPMESLDFVSGLYVKIASGLIEQVGEEDSDQLIRMLLQRSHNALRQYLGDVGIEVPECEVVFFGKDRGDDAIGPVMGSC
jgi:hypothetical protein